MTPFSTWSGSEGHPWGGPRFFVRLLTLLAVASAAAGCGGAQGPDRPRPGRGDALANPLSIYRDLGFMTGPGQFPAVASFSTVAGPGDSTYLVVGLSLPNSALRFQRDGDGFFAEYTVDLALLGPDSVVARRERSSETVRIPTFAETARTDESIVFQQLVTVVPGRYTVQLQAADANSARGFRMADTVTVPAYGAGAFSVTPPVLAYQAAGRAGRGEVPDLIVNPRHTVPYGGEAPLLYVESYSESNELDVRVVNDSGVVVWRSTATLEAGAGVADQPPLRYAVVTIPSETFPLGRFWIDVAGAGPEGDGRTPLLLTISDQWMVANFDDVLQFLRFIAYPSELDSLRAGTPTERRDSWERFWERRDPMPVTPLNEFREQFFQRVRFATEAFREAGSPGWQTDRGEVYIVLGPPDAILERFIGRGDVTGRPNAEEWVYTAAPGGRLNLLFHDRYGFGRLELIPSSASAFRSAADRLKSRHLRN